MWHDGYDYDAETTLYYLQSRYYDPEIGRFINSDAYASTGQGILGNNMFAYCLNNPVGFSDPDGYCAGLNREGAAYTSLCPVCGSSGGGNSGAGGGGIIIAIEEIFTGLSEVATEVAAWTTTASVYAYARTFVNTSADRFADIQPRVHHIIPKGKFRWYGPEIAGMMDEMHDMLIDAGIDINDPENLIIVSQGSHKTMHTKGYIIQIHNIMKQAENGGRDAVLQALDYARQYVASLDKYANGW